jgi:Iap family predicted aminopeptidase
MLQPCIDTERKRERKIVFLGGKASHVTTGFSVGSFPIPDSTVIEFAQQAYDAVILKLGKLHWLDQLARVDVMYNEFENRMVVNEIESIQACYEMNAHADKWYDEQVDNFLVDYYVDQFKKLVVQKIETMLIDGKITDSDN